MAGWYLIDFAQSRHANPSRIPVSVNADRYYTVANTLGVGFLEKVYENALAHEMRKRGLAVARQRTMVVFYDGVSVGEYTADLLVDDQVIVELKVAKALGDQHVSQCINYLRATNKPICLLINFGRPRIEIRRITLEGANHTGCLGQ